MRQVWTGLRWLYGLFFIVTAATMFAVVAGGMANPFRQKNAAAQGWSDAIEAAPFFTPLLASVYLLGGLCLLVARTIPLGLVLLTGPMAVIVVYHMTFNHDYAWGGLVGVVHVLMLWRYRRGFAPLWQWREDNRAGA